MTLAVGFFDGVHLGHRAILAGAEIALTFRTHPLETLYPEKAPKLLFSLEDRLAAIRAQGVKDIILLDFTAELAALSPKNFVEDYLLSRGITRVRCGANWNFGAKGAGKPSDLGAYGIAASVIPYAQYEGDIVSSTRIRAAITRGEMAAAQAMLGTPWFVRGELFTGKGLGHKIGYATLNFKIPSFYVKPPNGVYAVRYAGALGIANWGVAPTMGDARWTEPVLEIHFIEGTPYSFGDDRIEILKYIRPECKFPTVTDLQRQIAADIAQVQEEFKK